VTVLAFTSGLLDVFILGFGFAQNSLAICHLRLADGGLDAEFALHAVHHDLEVELAHAGNDGLACFLIGRDAECRIFIAELAESHAHLLLIGLGLWLDAERHDRLHEFDDFEDDRMLFVAESIGSQSVLESDGGGDLSGEDFLDLFALVGLEADDAAEALFLARRRIVYISAGFDGSGIDAEECQRADEWIVLKLESQSRERLFVICVAEDLFTCIRVYAFIGGMSRGDGR
jgi:hypothetical protein